MHYETAKMYEGPPCEMCQKSMFIGTCTHRPMKKPEWSPELLALAKRAAEASEAENAKVAAMSPEERKKYNEEWAERMAKRMVELGESELPI